jgi:hypothetical protein
MLYDETGPRGSRAIAAGAKKHERKNPQRIKKDTLENLGTSQPLHSFPVPGKFILRIISPGFRTGPFPSDSFLFIII